MSLHLAQPEAISREMKGVLRRKPGTPFRYFMAAIRIESSPASLSLPRYMRGGHGTPKGLDANIYFDYYLIRYLFN
jgi:hypothetical protein